MEIRHAPRLFVDTDLSEGSITICDAPAHYLQHVMRMKSGEPLRLFNGRDGEWLGRIGKLSGRALQVDIEKQIRPQSAGPDIWLCAAPIKKTHFDYMIEKVTELGVAVIQPMLTEHTQVRDVNVKRLGSIVTEAAEQSERLNIPEVRPLMVLPKLIADWPADRLPIVCAEWGDALSAYEAFNSQKAKTAKKTALFTGPEGGFTAKQFEALRNLPGVIFVRLGPRILRADTAASAALTLWQATCGDWK